VTENFDKIVSYIGLAQRAGAVLYGEDIISDKLRSAKLLLIDSGAPEKYVARVEKRFNCLPTFKLEGLREALHRDNVNAVAITNESLANAIIDILR
jgi:hypothetical protein